MKLLVVLALVGVAAAAVPQAQRAAAAQDEVQLVRFDTDSDGLGTYSFSYEQSDGSKRSEQSELKNAGTDDESIAIRGEYSWIAPDGTKYIVTYTADENGFQPKIEKA